jgi:4-hydroxy-3-methylbut-2-enyl diphosphate reductase
VLELCKQVDVLLVVGAKNSSNSNRLREIGTESGIPSYLVADGAELDPAWVANAARVGITAGASAPEAMVADVIDALRKVAEVDVSTMAGNKEHVEFRLPAELAERLPARQDAR